MDSGPLSILLSDDAIELIIANSQDPTTSWQFPAGVEYGTGVTPSTAPILTIGKRTWPIQEWSIGTPLPVIPSTEKATGAAVMVNCPMSIAPAIKLVANPLNQDYPAGKPPVICVQMRPGRYYFSMFLTTEEGYLEVSSKFKGSPTPNVSYCINGTTIDPITPGPLQTFNVPAFAEIGFAIEFTPGQGVEVYVNFEISSSPSK